MVIDIVGYFFPIALVTRKFEHGLATVAILIVFQPLILDSAGNVATQTLASNTSNKLSNHEKGLFLGGTIKEGILTGILNGFVINVIAFLMTNLFV